MKNMKLKAMGLLVAICSLVALGYTGCTAQNPNAGQQHVSQNPTTGIFSTNVEPAYIVDTNKIEQINQKVDKVLATATSINSMTSGFNPYAAPVQAGIDVAKAVEVGIPTVLAALSSVFAFFQNRGKKIQTAAASQLAKSPTNEHAIANASSPAVAAAIAQHAAEAQEVIPAPAPKTV